MSILQDGATRDPSGGGALEDLTDMDITAPVADGSVLQFDTATTTWKNVTAIPRATVEGIQTTDAPEFARLGVGTPADASIALDVLGGGGVLRLDQATTGARNAEVQMRPYTGTRPMRLLQAQIFSGVGNLYIGGSGWNDEPFQGVHVSTGPKDGYRNTRLSIDAQGNVVIGSAALATSATDGFLYIPSGPGAPTGVPTSKTGLVPLYYDSTNDLLYLYDGSWKRVDWSREPALGNPSASGQVLASTAAGVRSWTALPAAGLTSMTRLRASANQAAGSHAYTTLSWDTEDIDTDAYHDAGTPTLITIPAAGTYSAEVIAKSKAAPQGGTAGLQILLNGATVLASTRVGTPVSAPASLKTITDLEAYFPMEEPSGTSMADTSGSGYTATSELDTIVANDRGGYARDADNNLITLGAILPPVTGFTWVWRMKLVQPINQFLLGVTGLVVAQTWQGVLTVTGGESNFSTAKDAIPYDGSWCHVAMTWDQTSGVWKIYVNGIDVKTHNWTPGYSLSTSGNLTFGGQYKAPYLDYFQVFNRALTPTEILNLYTYTNNAPGNNTISLTSASAPASGTTLLARVPARAFAQGDTLAARWWQDSGSADNIEATAEMPSFTVIRLA